MGQRGRPKKEKPEMSEQQETPTFAEAKGLESNQHAKKLAKEKSEKKEQKSDTYYTLSGQKVLSLKVNEAGVFKEYVGSLAKKTEAPQIKIAINIPMNHNPVQPISFFISSPPSNML
jgi:hypothetical protein